MHVRISNNYETILHLLPIFVLFNDTSKTSNSQKMTSKYHLQGGKQVDMLFTSILWVLVFQNQFVNNCSFMFIRKVKMMPVF